VTAVIKSLSKTSLDHKQQEHIRVLAESSQSLVNLVKVLSASENEMGRLEIEQGRFAPPEVLAEVASLVRPLAESKGVDLRLDVTDMQSLWVTGDSGKIRQALLSLVHNAVRFTDLGFVELRTWQVHPGRIGFEVKDSGAGIPMHVRRRLLAPFLRADGSPWHRTRGRGVGVGVSRRLIESMGGALELDTALGLGTTARFVLDLPESELPDGVLPEAMPAVLIAPGDQR
jgi:signal transduction histidine kinase